MNLVGTIARLVRPSSLDLTQGGHTLKGRDGDLVLARDGDEVTLTLTRGEDVDCWRMTTGTFLLALGLDQRATAEAFARTLGRPTTKPHRRARRAES